MVELLEKTPADLPETPSITPAKPVYLTKAEAIERVTESESTVKKYLRDGRFPNAYKDETGLWRIPASDLAGAGLTLIRPGMQPPEKTPSEPVPDPGSNPLMTMRAEDVIELRSRAAALEVERDALSRQVALQERALAIAENAIKSLEAAPAATPAVIDLRAELAAATPPVVATSVAELARMGYWERRRTIKAARGQQ